MSILGRSLLEINRGLQEINDWANYARHTGVVQGTRAYAGRRHAGKLLRIHPQQYRAPVFLRSNTSDIKVFESVAFAGLYDSVACDAPGERTIVDLGANIGLSSIHFANRYPDARIISVEPDPENFRLLLLNTKAYPAITAVKAAIWSADRNLSIHDPGRGPWGMKVAEGSPQNQIEVRGVTMQSLIEEHGLKSIDILKIDIEGAEADVFSNSCAAWLDMVKVIVIELHDRYAAGCSQAFYSAIVRRPFQQWCVADNVIITFGQNRGL